MNKNVAFFSSLLILSLMISAYCCIPTVKSSPDIHQGDLILTGNNVTAIEGRFDINGSIVVEENATLILRNAIVNFTQAEDKQFNMTFRNPANGNPRLKMENSTVTHTAYNTEVTFFGNSSADINDSTFPWGMLLRTYDSSFASISNSSMYFIDLWGYSTVNLFNFTILTHEVISYQNSNLNVSNCTLKYLFGFNEANVLISNSTVNGYALTYANSANYSVTGLKPNLVHYWNFGQNCSVKVSPIGSATNFTLVNTQINGWAFESHSSNVTISDSTLQSFWSYSYDHSTIYIYNSAIEDLWGFGFSRGHLYNTLIGTLRADDDSRFWLVNSTSNTYSEATRSKVYICWYLNVHVIDSIGQDVPATDVTATYPNATVAESTSTDSNGWTRLTLMEKMMNATGGYPIGNYTVEATYDIHSDATTVNMTESQQITLTLEDFIIPEFPSLLILPLFMMISLAAVAIYRRKRFA